MADSTNPDAGDIDMMGERVVIDGEDRGHKPAVVRRITHRCRRVSAEDESGAEFIGGVDFEVVFAG